MMKNLQKNKKHASSKKSHFSEQSKTMNEKKLLVLSLSFLLCHRSSWAPKASRPLFWSSGSLPNGLLKL
jgi:hypothetical protein